MKVRELLLSADGESGDVGVGHSVLQSEAEASPCVQDREHREREGGDEETVGGHLEASAEDNNLALFALEEVSGVRRKGRKVRYEPEASIEPAGNETGNEKPHHLPDKKHGHNCIGNMVMFLCEVSGKRAKTRRKRKWEVNYNLLESGRERKAHLDVRDERAGRSVSPPSDEEGKVA
jgi:hypothetical protein